MTATKMGQRVSSDLLCSRFKTFNRFQWFQPFQMFKRFKKFNRSRLKGSMIVELINPFKAQLSAIASY
jgi:hypothetical protein